MKLTGKLTAVILTVAFLFCFVPSINAQQVPDGQTLVLDEESSADEHDESIRYQTVTYRTLDKDETCDFQSSITVAGTRYTLQGVEYKITGTATHRDEYVETTESYSGLYRKSVPESAEYINPINGKSHLLPLIDATYTDTIITDRSGIVVAEIDYGWQTYVPNPGATMEIDYFDAPSGTTLHGNVSFQSVVLKDPWQWMDITMPARFEVYEAEYYHWAGTDIYIPYSGDKAPAIAGLETPIARALGESETRFAIQSAEWKTDIYEKNGIEMRDATFFGKKHVSRYVATYASEWQLPDCRGYDSAATYGDTIDVLDGTEEYTIEAVATYQVQESILPFPVATAVLIGAGAFILIAGTVVLLVTLTRRKKKKQTDAAKK